MTKKTRICFVLLTTYGYFNPDAATAQGGGSRQYYMLSRALADEYDVHFIVGDYGQPETETREGVTLHRAYGFQDGGGLLHKPAQFYALYRAMRRADADIYVYRGYPWKAAFVYALTRILGRDWVYNINSDDHFRSYRELPPPVRWLFEHGIASASEVLVQTPEQADQTRATFGRDPAVIPNGYYPAEDTLPHDEREFFLWVGRLDREQKQPCRYLDLAARVPEASFLMIGTGMDRITEAEYQRALRHRIDELDNLTFLGPVNPEDVHDYYRRAIALINTSRYEGYPSTFPEAWRQDTPVVTLSLPLSKYVDDVIVDTTGDIDGLVEVVEDLATDPAYRARLSKPTYEHFRENLQFDRIVEEYKSALFRT
jgi:glycosyltransferase involved in cell wall biosynthesis